MSLLIAAFSFCFLSVAHVRGTCIPDVDCSGFVAPNTPLTTPHDSCTQPAGNITPTPCGRDRIFEQDCLSAGCCYRDGQCYMPLREDRVDYQFYGEAMSYKDAVKTCKTVGSYKVACVKDYYDYSRVRDKLCGNIWMSGAYSDRDKADMVPFYNETSRECSSQIGISCKLRSMRDTVLSLVTASEDSYFISLVNRSDTKPFLCTKERWRPHISMYPEHVTSTSDSNQMMCGLIFSGDALEDRLKVTWRLIHPNGTDELLKRWNYNITTTRQVYRQYITAWREGKYICIFSFKDDNEARVERMAWAYHYSNVTCNVTLDGGRNYAWDSGISITHQAEYKANVTVTTHCLGYPAPYIVSTVRVNGGDPVTRSIVGDGQNFVIQIDNFATEEQYHLGSDYSYELTLQPRSLLQTLANKTITITKLPSPTSCDMNFILSDEVETFESSAQLQAVERQVGVGEYFSVLLNCGGYPKPKITATKTTLKGVEVLTEDLTDTIEETSTQWSFENFSSEASLTQDYQITLNISVVPPPGQEPINFTLIVTKKRIPTTCTFNLTSNNETEVSQFPNNETDGSQDVIPRKSFAKKSFGVAASCTGYPAPDITAVKNTVKGDGPELEEVLQSRGATFNWEVTSFATEASPAQDYILKLTLIATSQDEPPIEMSLVIVKTVIMFDTDPLPRGEIIVGSTAAPSPDEGEGPTGEGPTPTANVAHILLNKEITLPCGGEGAEPFPKPTAFWEYNSERLDLSTSQLGQHIRYRNPGMSETDATILIKTQSSIVGGNYTCVISNGRFDSYSTQLRVTNLPPVPPGQTYITRIEGERVHAASSLQPSYLNMDIGFTGYLYAADTILDQITINQTEMSDVDGDVEGYFIVPPGSGKIRIGFKARNDYGDSEMSVLSEELEILSDTPSFSVATIKRDEDSTAPVHSSLSMGFTAIEGVDEYEVRLYSADGTLLKVLYVKDNSTVIEDLEAETGYSIAVRGVNVVAGEKVYGPSSLTSSFITAPAELPAPTGLNGQPLDSDGNTSAVLLTWDAPKVGGEFIEGYNLAYGPAAQPEGSDSEENLTRRRRQALQTVKTSFIPYGAKAAIVKELKSGTSYEFILKSYSSDFGESEPAMVTVQTLTTGPCPYTTQELYPPRYCEPRVSIDRQYLYIQFNLDCYDGTGLDYKGVYNTTSSGEQCAKWTDEHLKNFDTKLHSDSDTEGTNQCRNFKNSWKDATGLYDRPWCYLPGGRNESCSIRPCHSDLDRECYTKEGMSYKGEGHGESCLPWTRELLAEYNVTAYDDEVLGMSVCRNWEGGNMTRPWCVNSEGSKVECDVAPCGDRTTFNLQGTVTVEVKLGDSPAPVPYHISKEKKTVCVKLKDHHDTVKVGVKHSFGVQNCESEERSLPGIKIPEKVGVMDRLWVRYILIEIILIGLVSLLFGAIQLRKNNLPIENNRPSSTGSRNMGYAFVSKATYLVSTTEHKEW